VIDNSGTVEDLDERVEAAWAWITSRPEVPIPTGRDEKPLVAGPAADRPPR
jgi:hypothetical protein